MVCCPFLESDHNHMSNNNKNSNRKHKRKKKSNRRTTLIIAAVLAVAAVCIGLAVIVFSGDNSTPEKALSRISSAAESTESQPVKTTTKKVEKPNPLKGTWQYADGTKYRFLENYKGAMIVEKYEYKFTYKIEDNKLSIDYEKKEVHDAEYTFEVSGDVLKLKGGEGTAKGEYEMNRIEK